MNTEDGFRYYEIPQEYKDAGGCFPEIVQVYLWCECKEYGVDYYTVLALIERESCYRWDKVGDNGNSKGYMQIYEKWHTERMEAEGVTDLFNPYQNIRVGLNCLREIQDRLTELKRKLSGECVDFTEAGEEFLEELSMCDETVMESYLENGEITANQIQTLIRERKVFPCYFGSALKLEGVQELLDGLEKYMDGPVSGTHAEEAFGAKVYKISRDSQGSRLTHVKITNGVLKVKEILEYMAEEEPMQEKVNQIRIYSGDKYEMVQEAEKGCICAVTGLTRTYPGQGLGMQQGSSAPVLEPVLNYRVELPEGCDVHRMLQNFRQLEEEDPMLRVVWNEEAGEIQVQLMGEVQTEILQSLIKERFDVDISFGSGNIVYKETIKNTVEGVGHFEPLRHYAEVHLILEPGEPGSGITIDTICSEDVLDKNWQRLILTHVLEREHRGVLTGSVLTDVKITLASGRAHLKHTEGGDFRQAVYRAIRQGLMQAENVLLEPYYAFRLEIPSEMTGRALTDIQRMNGEFDGPET